MKPFYINLLELTNTQKKELIFKLNRRSWWTDWNLKVLSVKASPYLIYIGDSLKHNGNIFKGFKVSETPAGEEMSLKDFLELNDKLFVLNRK